MNSMRGGSCALMILPAPAGAQSEPVGTSPQSAETTRLETIIVTGYRQSLKSAREIKQNSDEVGGAIVAEDIAKLPDNNLVPFYEKFGFRARVAYNWRDDCVETTSGPGSGSLPVYTKPYGVLDASIGYNFNEHVDISFDASNLTRARFSTYFGQEIFDRTFGLVVRVRM